MQLATVSYAILLTRDAKTGRFTATIPDLPGFRCEADSVEEARDILHSAVTAWAASMRKDGESLPAPREYSLDSISVPTEDEFHEELSAARQFAQSVSTVCALTEDARREFVIAEAAVMDNRFSDATRHVEWSSDLLMQAHALLEKFPPHGQLERVHKLLGYGIALSMQATRMAMHGTCERDVDYVRKAEDQYVRGMEATKTALCELRRFVTAS
jgi:predicted RNase H-like HicB family nuclease